ncbi:MAG TPA: dihydrodipicolinate synthase family protein [Acidimicrobiales bacterium]|nr:dihydrodipicolinate synthase family protein [Acidimicrobiales bacterium]
MKLIFGERPFHNLFVPTVLPYAAGGFDVDEAALRRYLAYLTNDKFVAEGVGIVINSEAGELVYLTREEARRNVEIAVEVCGGRVPVVAGVAGLRPESMIEIAADAKDAGVDGLMLLPPMGAVDVSVGWNTVRYPEVWIDVAVAIDHAVDMPLIMHPVTNMTPEFGPGFPVNGVMKMVETIENVAAWKMTYSWQGWHVVARALRQYERDIALLGSGARYFHEAIALGIFDGALTGSLNYSLERSIDHFRAIQSGDPDSALKIWDSGLRQLQEFIFSEPSRFHGRCKIGGWIAGHVPHPFMRPPMPKPMPEEAETIRSLMIASGCPVIDEDPFRTVLAEISRVWSRGAIA